MQYSVFIWFIHGYTLTIEICLTQEIAECLYQNESDANVIPLIVDY